MAFQPDAVQVGPQRDQLDGGRLAVASGEVDGVVFIFQQPGVQAAGEDGHPDDRTAHEALKEIVAGAAGFVAAMWHRRGDDHVARMAGLQIASLEDDDDIDRIFRGKPGTGEVNRRMIGQVGAGSLGGGIVAAIPVRHGIGQDERARRLHRGRFALAPAKHQQGRHRGSDGTRAPHAPMLVQVGIVVGKERKQ